MAPEYRRVQDVRGMEHHYDSGNKDCINESFIVHSKDPRQHEHMSYKDTNTKMPSSRLSILEARFTLSDVYGPENRPTCPLHGGQREWPTAQLSLPPPPRELAAAPTHRRRRRSRSPFHYVRSERETWDSSSTVSKSAGMRHNAIDAERPYSSSYGWVEPGKGWTRWTSGGRSHRRSVQCCRPLRGNSRGYPQDQALPDIPITLLGGQREPRDSRRMFHEDGLGYPDKSGVTSCDRGQESDDPRYRNSDDWAAAHLTGEEAVLSKQGITDMTTRKNIELGCEVQTGAAGRKCAPFPEPHQCSARLEETQRMKRELDHARSYNRELIESNNQLTWKAATLRKRVESLAHLPGDACLPGLDEQRRGNVALSPAKRDGDGGYQATEVSASKPSSKPWTGQREFWSASTGSRCRASHPTTKPLQGTYQYTPLVERIARSNPFPAQTRYKRHTQTQTETNEQNLQLPETVPNPPRFGVNYTPCSRETQTVLSSDRLPEGTSDRRGEEEDLRSSLSSPNGHELTATLGMGLVSSTEFPTPTQDTRNECLSSPEGNPQKNQAPTAGSKTRDDSKRLRQCTTTLPATGSHQVTEFTLPEVPGIDTPPSEEQEEVNGRGSPLPTVGLSEKNIKKTKVEKATVANGSDTNEGAGSVPWGVTPVNDIEVSEQLGQEIEDKGSMGRVDANAVDPLPSCAVDRQSVGLVQPEGQVDTLLERRDTVAATGEGSAARTSAEVNPFAGDLSHSSSPSGREPVGRALAEGTNRDYEDVEDLRLQLHRTRCALAAFKVASLLATMRSARTLPGTVRVTGKYGLALAFGRWRDLARVTKAARVTDTENTPPPQLAVSPISANEHSPERLDSSNHEFKARLDKSRRCEAQRTVVTSAYHAVDQGISIGGDDDDQGIKERDLCSEDEALSSCTWPNNPCSNDAHTSAHGTPAASPSQIMVPGAEEIAAIRHSVRQQQEQSLLLLPPPPPLAHEMSSVTCSGVAAKEPDNEKFDDFEGIHSSSLSHEATFSFRRNEARNNAGGGSAKGPYGHGEREGSFLRENSDIAADESRNIDDSQDPVFRGPEAATFQDRQPSRLQGVRWLACKNRADSSAACPIYAVGAGAWEAESRQNYPDDRSNTTHYMTMPPYGDENTAGHCLMPTHARQDGLLRENRAPSEASKAPAPLTSSTMAPGVVSYSLEQESTAELELEEEEPQQQQEQQPRHHEHRRHHGHRHHSHHQQSRGVSKEEEVETEELEITLRSAEDTRQEEYRRECAVLAGTAKIVFALSALEYRRVSARFFRWKRRQRINSREERPPAPALRVADSRVKHGRGRKDAEFAKGKRTARFEEQITRRHPNYRAERSAGIAY